jgi:hypothetical protein
MNSTFQKVENYLDKRVVEIINKYLNRNSLHLFLGLGLLTIIPLLSISFFNNPGSDDFDFSYKTKLLSFYDIQIWRYNNEGGRYFANGLLSLNPLVFNNYFLFKIIPITVILFLIFCIHFFVSSLLHNTERIYKWSIVSLLFFLFIVQLPDVCHGFYWITGAITYQLPLSLSLLFFGFLIRYFHHNRIIDFIASILVLFATIGCNEIVIVILLFLLSFVFLVVFNIQKKISKPLFIALLFFIFFTCIEITAPGNSVRDSLMDYNHQLFRSVTKSFLFSIQYVLEWIPMLLICCLFLVEKIYEHTNKIANKVFFIHPILSVFLLFSVFYIAIFVGFWSLNNILPARALNVLYFYSIFLTLYSFCCFLYYLKSKHNYVIQVTKQTRLFLGLIIFCLAFSKTPLFLAYHDLLIGKAYHYNKEMALRFEIIRNSKEKKIILPALFNKPPTIYNNEYMGITTDKNNWKNLEISLYYDKEIIVKPSDSIFTE